MIVCLVFAVALVAPSLGARMPYIVGGIPVDNADKYPFMASLQRGPNNVCGGALVSDQWVVTAAHCLQSKIDQVVLGRLSVTDDSIGAPEYYAPMGFLRHADYTQDDTIGNPNDIGLIKLGQAAKLGEFISTIPLADSSTTFKDCVIMGWGHTKSGVLPGPTSDRLQEANVSVFTQDFCKGRWSAEQIKDSHICVGLTGLVSACSSDGGGPLACKNADNEMVLAGVMSFTQYTCGPGTPSVYTRISSFRDWLKENSCGAL